MYVASITTDTDPMSHSLSCILACATSLCAPLFPPPYLLAVCYSCWSNLENVPNPLSVLLPQRNTKWIRLDYCLPLPPSHSPPPSRSPPPLPLLLLQAITLSSSSHFPNLATCYGHLSPDISFFIRRIKAFSLFRWQIGSNALPSDRCSHRPTALWNRKYR